MAPWRAKRASSAATMARKKSGETRSSGTATAWVESDASTVPSGMPRAVGEGDGAAWRWERGDVDTPEIHSRHSSGENERGERERKEFHGSSCNGTTAEHALLPRRPRCPLRLLGSVLAVLGMPQPLVLYPAGGSGEAHRGGADGKPALPPWIASISPIAERSKRSRKFA